MNPKIFVGVAVAALAIILGGILLTGPTIEITNQENTSETNVPQAKPIQIELEDISIAKISERSVTIDIAFKLSNPNPRAMIVVY